MRKAVVTSGKVSPVTNWFYKGKIIIDDDNNISVTNDNIVSP